MLLGCAAIFPTPNTLGLPFWGKGWAVSDNKPRLLLLPPHTFQLQVKQVSITQAATTLYQKALNAVK